MAKNTGFAALSALQFKPATLEEAKPEVDINDVDAKSDRGLTPVVATLEEAAFQDVGAEEGTSTPAELPESPSEESLTKPKPAQPVFDDIASETPNGGIRLVNDIPVSQWTDEELDAYIAGTVSEDTYLDTLRLAITEHRIRRDQLAVAWTVDECREFLKQGIVPAKTSKGAWVNDVTRKYRREHEWETNELESWALGEIKAEGATLDAGLAIELKQRLNLQLPGVDVTAVITNYRHLTNQVTEARVEPRPEPQTTEVTEQRVAEVTKQIQLEGLTPVNQSYIESSLAQFENVMKPGRAITEVASGEAQKLLRNVIMYAISIQDPVGARSAMQYLIDYFRARRDVGKIFEDTYAFRGINDMKATKKEQVAHHDLLTLFLVFADPMVELRQQTDIPSLIGGVPAHLQSRVIEFFSRVQ